jgi:hypothetical protein
MDIALKTLVLIVFILVPGFLFRRVYFQGTFSKQFDSKTWSHSLFYSALFGIIINFLAYNCYEEFIKIIDYKACLKFYTSISKESLSEKDLDDFNIKSIYKYLGILYGLAIVVAWIIYLIVRNFKLDRYFAPLRFSDHWHYYFKGEIKDFKEFTLSKGKCSVVTADVLVKSEKDGSNLYSGLLSSYSLDDKGALESISLTQVQIFKKDTKTFKDIHSTVFIIPNSNILNINLRYTFQEEDTTIIDFIFGVLFLLSLAIIWIDPFFLLYDYSLIFKIFLKLLTSITMLGSLVTFFSIFRYLSYDKSLKLVLQSLSEEKIDEILKYNQDKSLRIRKLKKEISDNLLAVLFFLTLLALIIVFTY